MIRSNATQHLKMLMDRQRADVLRAAVAECVKPGDVVLDLGAGTGLLSFWALEQGAARVHAIESDPLAIRALEAVSERRGTKDRLKVHQGISLNCDLGERVDVILSEILGVIGLDEGLLPSLADARARFLAPGGVMMPRWVEILAAPATLRSPEDGDGQVPLDQCLHGLAAALSQCLVNPTLVPDQLLGAAKVLERFDLSEAGLPWSREFFHLFQIGRGGVLDGFAGWFRAGLTEKIVLSSSPQDPVTHWGQAFFPIEEPGRVEPGDEVWLGVRFRSEGANTLFGARWYGGQGELPALPKGRSWS